MRKLSFLFSVVAAMALATAAFGDGMDPAMDAVGTDCPTAPAWCTSVGLAVDPQTGIRTEEYIFDSDIPSVVDGDWEIFQGSLSGPLVDLLQFENINGVAVVFIYSDDIVGSLAANVPASTYGTVDKVVEDIGSYTTFTPTSVEAGYSAIGRTNGYAEYGLDTADVVPEPSSVVLFGSILILAAGALRRYGRQSNR